MGYGTFRKVTEQALSLNPPRRKPISLATVSANTPYSNLRKRLLLLYLGENTNGEDAIQSQILEYSTRPTMCPQVEVHISHMTQQS